MSIILLDTNVVSFVLKGDSRAQLYESYLQGQQMALSFMTVAELYQWAAIRQWGKQRIRQLEKTLRETYIVLSFDIALCQLWGEVRAKRRAIGNPISPEDAWIAATALHYDIPLVTHNPADFENIKDLTIVTKA
jgi:tRNA(fMet)-specific endonuclease VapC